MPTADDERATRIRSFEWLSEASDLGDAFALLSTKPKDSMAKCRNVLESLLKSLLPFENIPLPSQPTVGNMLRDVKSKIPKSIAAAVQYVNEVASDEGVHTNVPRLTSSWRVIDHVCDVLDWYASDYLGSGLVDNFGAEIGASDALVVYVSSGGTCRCAIANVITHHLRTIAGLPSQLRTISAALNEPTREMISQDAADIVRERLQIDAASHRTIPLNQRHIRRADVMLAFDYKLAAQLKSRADKHHVGSKVRLFTEFFGSSGEIFNPWDKGPEEYVRRFDEIYPLITANGASLAEVLAGRRQALC